VIKLRFGANLDYENWAMKFKEIVRRTGRTDIQVKQIIYTFIKNGFEVIVPCSDPIEIPIEITKFLTS